MPSALEDIRSLWAEFMDRGELHATLRFRRLDGSPREIEYHVTREGAGPQRHLAVVRGDRDRVGRSILTYRRPFSNAALAPVTAARTPWPAGNEASSSCSHPIGPHSRDLSSAAWRTHVPGARVPRT